MNSRKNDAAAGGNNNNNNNKSGTRSTTLWSFPILTSLSHLFSLWGPFGLKTPYLPHRRFSTFGVWGTTTAVAAAHLRGHQISSPRPPPPAARGRIPRFLSLFTSFLMSFPAYFCCYRLFTIELGIFIRSDHQFFFAN